MDLCSRSHQEAISISEAWRSHYSAQRCVPGKYGTRENGIRPTIWRRQNRVERDKKKKPYRGANGEWTVNMWAKQGREVMCNPLSTDLHRMRVQRDWTLGARRWSEQAHLLQEAPGAPWGRTHPTGWDSGGIRLDENCIRLGRPAIDHGPSISTKGFRCAVPVVQYNYRERSDH